MEAGMWRWPVEEVVMPALEMLGVSTEGIVARKQPVE